MPEGGNAPIMCLWETKEKMSVGDFQKFIDGPDGPSNDCLVNEVYKVMPGGILPPSYFAGHLKSENVSAATSGSFFWIFHKFVKGKENDFWELMKTLDLIEYDDKNR